ncbi:MAG: UDP-2-acetamido-2-deoxy-3-oxo-D-glucuronate aminotransferase [Pelotomaculum sp. PtaU1.Bin035]|nr:MAG: UDP-2-acetamido-2-deoxy-3-oxo-D-glucuronate aminotransferase [Pelotomaculum sp. PtaU1.Bin035]
MGVALFDLQSQYLNLRSEINEAVGDVLAAGRYILGPRVQMLEEQVAGYCGVKYGVGVASGTDAIFLSLVACGIGEGDEVITTPYTFFATAGAISRAGATPVFADIDPLTYNIDPEKIEAGITGRTKAVIPVHIFGQMADMDAILTLARKYNLVVIEDACQALGSENRGRKAGSLGVAGCVSFFPTKNLGCCGDGGMVITSDEKIAAKIKALRAHGSSKKFFHDTAGCNSRLDEIQAAILLVKLKYLEEWLDERAALAAHYSRLLTDIVETPFVMPGNRHTYHLYVIRAPQRELIKKYLEKNDVSCGMYYPLPLHLQVAYESLRYRKGDFPEAEKASETLLAIPLYPELALSEAERIALLIRRGIAGE